jgi:hypothetical protein
VQREWAGVSTYLPLASCLDGLSSARRRRVRDVGLILFAIVLYAAAALAIYPHLGAAGAAVPAAVPVVVAGYFRGQRAGVLAGALVYALSMLLLSLVTGEPHVFGPGAGLGLPVLMVVGGGVGRLHDLRAQLADELRARLAAEAELRERVRLEGVLLAARTAAHEVNNHLTTTAGYACLLVDDARLPDDLRAVADEVATGALAAGRVLEQLQALTRIEERDWGPYVGVTIDIERSGGRAPHSRA